MIVDQIDNPLSSAHLRLEMRRAATARGPGADRTRPFGLRCTVVVPAAVRPAVGLCARAQVAIDLDGRPLIETMGKEWRTKSSTDGDEGPEEDYGWEEE